MRIVYKYINLIFAPYILIYLWYHHILLIYIIYYFVHIYCLQITYDKRINY